MNSPLILLKHWLEEERTEGNPFGQGAVLCTISNQGAPRSRVVGAMLGEDNRPKFHTSPISSKIKDIEFQAQVSLTYSFQTSLRSINLEGELRILADEELDADWSNYDLDFRRHYLVFGQRSGEPLSSPEELVQERAQVSAEEANVRPDSFTGYRLENISQICFYKVKEADFATSTRFLWDREKSTWTQESLVP